MIALKVNWRLNFSRIWITLPGLNQARWFHACSLVTRFNVKKHMVVIGGTTAANEVINTIEYYNLAWRPSSWTVDGN